MYDPISSETFVDIRRTIPRIWWNIYQGCLDAGFNKEQAFKLVQTKILGDGTGGIHAPESEGPPKDTE